MLMLLWNWPCKPSDLSIPPTELEWNVYPNPVINELHFTIVEDLPEIAEIIDIEGNVCEKTIQDGKLRVSDLAPGTYFIRLIIKDRVQQERFIKLWSNN